MWSVAVSLDVVQCVWIRTQDGVVGEYLLWSRKKAELAGRMEKTRRWPKVVESCRRSGAEVAGLAEFLEEKQTSVQVMAGCSKLELLYKLVQVGSIPQTSTKDIMWHRAQGVGSC